MKALRFWLVISSLLMVSLPPPLLSHHQLGLPHYLYSEEYPQIPTMVIDADAEGYTVTFSMYPGNPGPGDVVRIKVYIKHKTTGKVYTEPIKMSVNSVTFLGGEKEVVEPSIVSSNYNEYKKSYQFDKAEKYLVNVAFEPREDFLEKIPFPIVIGKTNFSLVPIIFGVVFLAIFIGVGFTKKRKRKAA